jgi:hypothetical protein
VDGGDDWRWERCRDRSGEMGGRKRRKGGGREEAGGRGETRGDEKGRERGVGGDKEGGDSDQNEQLTVRGRISYSLRETGVCKRVDALVTKDETEDSDEYRRGDRHQNEQLTVRGRISYFLRKTEVCKRVDALVTKDETEDNDRHRSEYKYRRGVEESDGGEGNGRKGGGSGWMRDGGRSRTEWGRGVMRVDEREKVVGVGRGSAFSALSAVAVLCPLPRSNLSLPFCSSPLSDPLFSAPSPSQPVSCPIALPPSPPLHSPLFPNSADQPSQKHRRSRRIQQKRRSVEDIITDIRKENSDSEMYFINPNGLMTNQQETLTDLKEIMKRPQCDMIGIAEAKCKGSHTQTIRRMTEGWTVCEIRRRQRNKRNRGVGGGVMLIARDDLEPKKMKRTIDDLMWVRMKRKGGGLMFVAVIYLPPGNRWRTSNEKRLQHLEAGILLYGSQGQVVVMGDMNMRVGELTQTIELEEGKEVVIERVSDDKKVTRDGKDLVERMNAMGMVLMNGVDGRGKECTCSKTEGGSVIDMLWIKLQDVGRVREMSVMQDHDVGSDHHFMLRMMLEWNGGEDDETEEKEEGQVETDAREEMKEEGRNENETKKWKCSPKGDKQYFEQMEALTDGEMMDWWEKWGDEEIEVGEIDEIWGDMKAAGGRAWGESIGMKGGGRGGEKKKTERPWYEAGRDATVDYWKKRDRRVRKEIVMERDKPRRERWLNEHRMLKKMMRGRVRMLKKSKLDHMRKTIENWRKTDSRTMWATLKKMANWKGGKGEALPKVMVDTEGRVVKDKEGCGIVWMEAWKALGMEDMGDAKFDKSFAEQIERELIETEMNDGWEGDRADARGREEMRRPISLMEMREACKRLKYGKAAGDDEVLGEWFKKGGERVVYCMWWLCKEVWRREEIPTDWSKGVVVPLYKGKGDKRNPLKYRGITLLSVAGKVFCSILNTRLMTWVEESEGVVDEQGGFRPGRGCPDQLFALTEILKSRQGKKTFTCFIDIKKAYDRVWRKGMWACMRKRGVVRKMERVLKQVYKRVTSCVRVEKEKTDWFEIDVGLRQGCVMSPVLFSMFIDEVARKVKDGGYGVEIDEGEKVALLLYADDIVMFAESESRLQEMIDVVVEHSKRWRFELSPEKTQVVVFGGKPKRSWAGFRLGREGREVEVVNTYKYLGMEVGKGLRWKEWKEKTIRKARGAMQQAWALGMQHGGMTVAAGIGVWSTLVRPLLEYGAEVWGGVRDHKWEEAEKIMRQMGRRILGVAGKTPNELVRGELGWWTMKGRRDRLRLMYFGRLVRMKEERVTKRVYRVSRNRYIESSVERGGGRKNKRTVDNWSRYTHRLLADLGLEEKWEKEEVGTEGEWRRDVEAAIQAREQREWWRVMTTKKKLTTYRRHKRTLEREDYLDVGEDVRGRQILTRLRGGCAGLMVEMGRRCGEGAVGRFCPLCDRMQEDERHFVMNCPALEEQRTMWYGRLDKILEEEEQRDRQELREGVHRARGKPMSEKSRDERMGLLFGQGIPDNRKTDAVLATMMFARTAMTARDRLIQGG